LSIISFLKMNQIPDFCRALLCCLLDLFRVSIWLYSNSGWLGILGGMKQSPCPLVGIIMGSDSDLPSLRPAAELLEYFGIAYEMLIVSAHRTPGRLFEYATKAAGRGLKVIIAGAGGAAHLPGMAAAMTDLPVVAVPVRSKTLDGLDSLLSIVQMPAGIPVACMAIDGGKNAGLMAARILATADAALAGRLADYRHELEAEVLAKSAVLEAGGPSLYQAPSRPAAGWAGLDGGSAERPLA